MPFRQDAEPGARRPRGDHSVGRESGVTPVKTLEIVANPCAAVIRVLHTIATVISRSPAP